MFSCLVCIAPEPADSNFLSPADLALSSGHQNPAQPSQIQPRQTPIAPIIGLNQLVTIVSVHALTISSQSTDYLDNVYEDETAHEALNGITDGRLNASMILPLMFRFILAELECLPSSLKLETMTVDSITPTSAAETIEGSAEAITNWAPLSLKEDGSKRAKVGLFVIIRS
ncbi:unnamed protein product [Protopolystoma xenopodis]|uniref:Uncharacterized protein n=1 Tax=Protopolystoma xenopodis TaxID=117903 RepID=A0A3S5C167_9PLAT|nr:unnamed protein product [Protopolystoma xenopodis]